MCLKQPWKNVMSGMVNGKLTNVDKFGVYAAVRSGDEKRDVPNWQWGARA